jgi:hypothetical protein
MWRGGKGDEVSHRGLQYHLASKSRVDLLCRPWLKNGNIHNLEVRSESREGGRDQGIPAQARPDSISHLFEFRQGGNIIGEEGEASICMVDRLHPKRGFLPESAIDGSHKGGESVCRRGSLQQDKDLPA